VKRLENDKKKIQLAKRKDARNSAQNLSGLQSGFDTQSCLVSSLSADINLLEDRLRRHAETAAATLKKVRAERKAYKMQAQRAQRSLSEARHDFKELSTWSTKKGHMYSMETRRLVLRICGAGCAESKVRDIVLWCAEVFRIRVTHFTLTARTVGRIKREGGYISLIQIGHEINMMYGMLALYIILKWSHYLQDSQSRLTAPHIARPTWSAAACQGCFRPMNLVSTTPIHLLGGRGLGFWR
jgi:hypothetical protein